MRKPRVGIASEGLRLIGIFGIIAWLAAILDFYVTSILFAAATFFILFFFRDPEREISEEPHAVISPADGKIIGIEKTCENDFLSREMQKISISLAVTDCHINRFPVSGTVEGTKYVKGSFHMANYPSWLFSEKLKRSSEDNERLSTLIDNGGDQIVMCQVAGFLARRIVSYAEFGSSFKRGERFGMIKFGSRVDIYLPLNCEVTAELGDTVRAGETIIGWLKETE